MFIDSEFGLLMLPIGIAAAACLGVGYWVWDKFAPNKAAAVVRNMFYFVGIAFLGIGAIAIVFKMFGPFIVGMYCSFATCG